MVQRLAVLEFWLLGAIDSANALSSCKFDLLQMPCRGREYICFLDSVQHHLLCVDFCVSANFIHAPCALSSRFLLSPCQIVQ